jgi:hypothetical protein
MWDSTTVRITAMRLLYQGTTVQSCRNPCKIDSGFSGFAFLRLTRLRARDLRPGIRTHVIPVTS